MHSSDKCGEWHILSPVDGEVRCVDCGLTIEGVELLHPLQIARVVVEDV